VPVCPSDIHSTRLKEKVLQYFPDMRSEKAGREYLLCGTGSIGDSIRMAWERNPKFHPLIILNYSN
jgi:hypothetical protein